jgi:sigma-54 interacting transcriptional regulator
MATPHDRLGSTRTQCVDVRLVAATSRNLEQMVRGKQFREDLFSVKRFSDPDFATARACGGHPDFGAPFCPTFCPADESDD